MAENNQFPAKKKKWPAVVAVLLVIVLAVCIGLNSFIGGMYQSGTEVNNDIKTARELQDKVINILVCGLDYEDGRTSILTDVILYVTLDVEGGRISALQIPRDTYIGDDIRTGGTKKVNAVYSNGSETEKIMNLVSAVNDKLGLAVDHYVTLDMESLIKMVDWIDWGFEMYVPYPIILKDKSTGEEQTMISEPGWYTVTGEEVELIVRNRNYTGSQDSKRQEVQRYFYASLAKNFMENLNTSDFIKVMSRFTQYITTDMHWTKIASIAQFVFTVDYDNMTFITPAVHGYDVKYSDTGKTHNILVAEKEEWTEILNTYFRPYQDSLSADQLEIPGTKPAGEQVNDWGVVKTSQTTIGDLLGNAVAE